MSRGGFTEKGQWVSRRRDRRFHREGTGGFTEKGQRLSQRRDRGFHREGTGGFREKALGGRDDNFALESVKKACMDYD